MNRLADTALMILATFIALVVITAAIRVGGLVPDPINPGPGWKSELALDYLKVWR